jgi:protein-S-isoprenylcysteine O-methyltransferase Ste14
VTADAFLFRYRFWVIAVLFFLGFQAYSFDHVNVAAAAVRACGVSPDAPEFARWVRAVFALGAVLTILAAAIRTWAAAYLGSDVVHSSAARTESLVADGPYRHVRNPLYLGLLLLAFGFAFAANREGFLLIVVGMTALVLRLVAHEEAALSAAQGEAYDAYRRAVPRLLPSLRPRVAASDRRPRFGQAFLGEAFFWVFAAGAVAFALTENGILFALTAGAGLAVFGISLAIAAALQRRDDRATGARP